MRPDSGPSGRKRNPIIERARRAQIIEAAIETVADVGYSGASLARIAERGQLSKSVISYHYNGRDELLERVVTQIFDDSWAFIEPRLTAADDAAGKLRAYVEANIAYLTARRTSLLAMVEIFRNHRDAHGSLRFGPDIDRTVLDLLVGILRQGQHEGRFRDFDPRVMAVTVHQAVFGAMGQWAADADLDMVAYSTELVALFDRATRREPT
jgi:AcrR family transcriptional regulator